MEARDDENHQAKIRPKPGLFLISEAEWRQERATPEPPSPRFSPAPGAPRLELLQPKPGPDVLPSPIDIQLRWNAEGEARIEPQSLRIRKAALPSGEHKLSVEIADSLQGVGRRQFEERVQAAP